MISNSFLIAHFKLIGLQILFLRSILTYKSTDDGSLFGPINTFRSNEFNRKKLTLRKNPSFTAYYQSYVISRCMDPNFKPWSMEKAMSFKEFITDVNSKMFLCISCICFLTKSVPAYQALAKIMEKAEYRLLAHEFQWEDINKKFLSSLFPSDDLNNDNLQLMIDSWIAIYELNGNTCPDIYASFSTLKVACNVTKR